MNKILIYVASCLLVLFGQTTEQIKKAKTYIKQSGMTKTEVLQQAKIQGYSEKDLKRLLGSENTNSDLKNLSDEKLNENSKTIPLSNQEEKEKKIKLDEKFENSDELDIIDEFKFLKNFESQDRIDENKYFGYDIFKRDPSLFQGSSMGTVDPEYLIGPNDELIIMLWGETQFRQVLTVDKEGFVFIPEIGQVFVNGLNLNLLESKLFRVFSQSYQSLSPQNGKPTTFLDVSLGNLRPLRVQVLGEVSQPGAYTVSRSATLFSSLYYFNGPSTLGSLRDIHLIRRGKKIASIDFYDYLLTGKKPNDQKLQLDDIIFIPPRKKTVQIKGEVKRPGIYELKENETMIDLINLSGNLKVTAYLDLIQIDRIVPFEDREIEEMDRRYIDLDLNQILDKKLIFKLEDGDVANIYSIPKNRNNFVEIFGAITRPGKYDLGNSLKISDLINKADGLMGDAYIERIDLIRTKEDFTEKLIKLNLEKVLSGDVDHDIYLQGLDKIKIYSLRDMIPKSYVSIDGHVKLPGRYTLQQNMTLYDIIFKAGGFLDEEFLRKTYLKRADIIRNTTKSNDKKIISFNLGDLLEKKENIDLLLQADDLIKVYSTKQIEGGLREVLISGNVKYPGKYELFEDNMRIRDLLFKAGGFDDPLFKAQTYLKRADLLRFDKDRITKSIIKFNLNNILNDNEDIENIILMPGDEIIIYPENLFNSVKYVSIDGVIQDPGKYSLKTNMSLKDLILEAGGLAEDIYRYRIEIARVDPFNKSLNEFAKTIILNIDGNINFLNDQFQNDSNNSTFKLEPYDHIVVRPDPYFNFQKKVFVKGEVLYPGEYIILSLDQTITDIIERAGGLKENAYLKGSKFTRNGLSININLEEILKKPKSKLNINVQHGDVIEIVKFQHLVFINGEVNNPGVYKHLPKKSLEYYLDIAGGLTNDANPKTIWVKYPNGKSKKYKKRIFKKIKIYDGTHIFIDKKEDREPIDRTELAKEITSIFSNIAQIVVMITLAK